MALANGSVLLASNSGSPPLLLLLFSLFLLHHLLILPHPPPSSSSTPALTSSSSSSISWHSGLTRGRGTDSGARVGGSGGILNFSAAALCTCWDRSSICRNVGIHVWLGDPDPWGSHPTQIPLCPAASPRAQHLGLPKDHIGIRGRALEDVGLGDDEQDVLGLLDCDSGDALDLPQAQLGHGLGTGAHTVTLNPRALQELRSGLRLMGPDEPKDQPAALAGAPKFSVGAAG